MDNYIIKYDTKLFKNVEYPIIAETDGQAITKAFQLFKRVDKIINITHNQIIYENGTQNFYHNRIKRI